MAENININNTAEGGENNTPNAEEKTFTQDQLNAIIGERLSKERAKAEAELADRERELANREFQLSAKATLTEKGYPVELLDALNCSDAESLGKCLEIIEKHIRETIKKQTPAPIAPINLAPGQAPVRDSVRAAMGLR